MKRLIKWIRLLFTKKQETNTLREYIRHFNAPRKSRDKKDEK